MGKYERIYLSGIAKSSKNIQFKVYNWVKLRKKMEK